MGDLVTKAEFFEAIVEQAFRRLVVPQDASLEDIGACIDVVEDTLCEAGLGVVTPGRYASWASARLGDLAVEHADELKELAVRIAELEEALAETQRGPA
jgi:hypothetical protein